MLKFSYGSRQNKEGERVVFLNGRLLQGATASIHKASKMGDRTIPKFTGVTFTDKSVDAIQPFTIADLFAHIDHFNIGIDMQPALAEPTIWGFNALRISPNLMKKANECAIHIPVDFDLDQWNQPYSVSELATWIHYGLNRVQGKYWFQENVPNSLMEGFGLFISFPINTKIGDVLTKVVPDLEEITNYTRGILEPQIENALTTQFDFPVDVRPACEQYLLYFGQFLRDLGIEADTQLTEQASQVLFTIQPRNREQALDAIRQALNCYLQMPDSPEAISALSSSQDISAMQWQSNIFYLKSQLSLVNAIAQTKDAFISAQQAQIDFLRQSLDLRHYIPPPSSNNADEEPLIKDIVSVKKVDYKGLAFNLPEILRRLKRKFN